jgi:hypothetical protein
MANVKMTQKEMYAEIKDTLKRVEFRDVTGMIDFIDKKIEQLEHKSDTKQMTVKQAINAAIKERLVEFLACQDEKLTCTEIFNLTDIGLTSATHASALLKQLVDVGQVVKEYEKKVAKFYVASDADEGE